MDDEAVEVQRGTDHRHPAGAGGRSGDGGCVLPAWGQQRDLPQVEGEVLV
jgi:hypothetical protein